MFANLVVPVVPVVPVVLIVGTYAFWHRFEADAPSITFDLGLPPGMLATEFVAHFLTPNYSSALDYGARIRGGALPWVRFASAVATFEARIEIDASAQSGVDLGRWGVVVYQPDEVETVRFVYPTRVLDSGEPDRWAISLGNLPAGEWSVDCPEPVEAEPIRLRPESPTASVRLLPARPLHKLNIVVLDAVTNQPVERARAMVFFDGAGREWGSSDTSSIPVTPVPAGADLQIYVRAPGSGLRDEATGEGRGPRRSRARGGADGGLAQSDRGLRRPRSTTGSRGRCEHGWSFGGPD